MACCRRVWNLLPDDAERAVDVAERFADGRASGESLHGAARRAKQAADQAGDSAARGDDGLRTREAHFLAYMACRPDGEWYLASFGVVGIAARLEGLAAAAGRPPADALAPYLELLRDIVGPLPFRSIAIDPTWLA